MWIYDRFTGVLRRGTLYVYKGCYAGHGAGLNNTAMQNVHDIGPLPAAIYDMTAIVNSPHTGQQTIVLKMRAGYEDFGRDGFRIHGDNGKGDKSASNGCIIQDGAANRLVVWNSGDHVLQVV